jgi:H+-transporting ATPase
VKNVTFASLIIGALLVVEGTIAVFIVINNSILGWKELQTFVMLMFIFSSQFRVLVVKERRHFWSSQPRRESFVSTMATIGGFELLGVYDIIFHNLLTPYQVLFIMEFSALFILGIDFHKYYVFRKFGL